jgi:hypothetical protein
LHQLLQAVDGEGELGVERLLDPERAVIVEDGDALGGGMKSGVPARGKISRGPPN